MAAITLQAVDKTFGKTEVIKQVAMDIRDGEFAVFVGPSGCGKSTLLRLILMYKKIFVYIVFIHIINNTIIQTRTSGG